MSHDSRRPVTVEDLLRLKRCEQPAPEFWESFDQQLRAKQLAALVEKRSLWQRLPSFAFRWYRWAVPLGAAGALALTWVSLGEPETPATQPALASPATAKIAVAAPAAPTDTTLSPALTPVQEVPLLVAAAGPEPLVAESTPSEFLPVEPVDVSSAAPSREVAGVAAASVAESAATSAKFAVLPSAESVLAGGLLEVAQPAAVNSPTARPRVEPLAQMVVSTEAQGRSRLTTLAMATVAMNFPQGPARDATERQARSLSNDQLYERPKGRVRPAGGNAGLGLGVGM